MSEIKLVNEFPLETAEEFLEIISPTGKIFKDYAPDSPWVFRGQGKDSGWTLTPSLFRADAFSIDKLKAFTNLNVDNLSELLLLERDLVVQFFEIADNRGLVIPDDSQQLRVFLESLKSFEDQVRVGGWRGRIKDKALSLMALAQHYGIQTRLLDWTKRSYIAAFFAAESAFSLLRDKKINPEDRFVVWSLFYPTLGKQNEDARLYEPLIVVTAPKATNTNLQAQQGIFSLVNSIYLRDYDETKSYLLETLSDIHNENELKYLNDASKKFGGYPSLDLFIEYLVRTIDKMPTVPERELVANLVKSIKFYKFTIPASKASNLLYLLSKHDITYSTIYPGYHSISADMKLQKLKE